MFVVNRGSGLTPLGVKCSPPGHTYSITKWRLRCDASQPEHFTPNGVSPVRPCLLQTFNHYVVEVLRNSLKVSIKKLEMSKLQFPRNARKNNHVVVECL